MPTALRLLTLGFQYTVYAAEALVLVSLLRARRWMHWLEVFCYITFLLLTDTIARPLVLYSAGGRSLSYAYFYWFTDVALVLGMFLLIGAFFRRACKQEPELWQHIRLFLPLVLVLVAGVSFVSLSKNYDQIFSPFIIEFEQNLYFTCLVLNTLLFILMQRVKSTDDELQLLVCGVGIQFAGPAAGWALVHLTPGWHSVEALLQFFGPLCTLGMLLVWVYAVTHVPRRVPARGIVRTEPAVVVSDI